MELLFGAGPQLWPSTPMPSFGNLQMYPAHRPSMVVQPQSEPATTINANWPATMSPVYATAAVDFSATVTPQAVLQTVAIRRGQPAGPVNDQDAEDFIYDALDLLPGANDVEVRCESGRVTLTGAVPHKRVKRDVGEVIWAIPIVNDVQNNVTIATRRRSRPQGREPESTSVAGGRKTA